MSNVIGLHGHEIAAPGSPSPDVVEIAEKFLEMARSGVIDGAAVLMHHGDGDVSSLQRGQFSFRLIGLGQTVIFDMCRDMSKGQE